MKHFVLCVVLLYQILDDGTSTCYMFMKVIKLNVTICDTKYTYIILKNILSRNNIEEIISGSIHYNNIYYLWSI